MGRHEHQHDHHTTGNIRIAFFLNLGFTCIELVGGWMTNSLAILSDAVHDLGDSLSLGTAWYFQRLSKKGRDRQFSYGYKRFSLLGAIINSLVLVVSSIFIISEAIPRIFDPQPVDVNGMILLAVFGILANGLAVWRLRRGSSLNEKVVSLHLLEDVLGWVAVLIGSIVMRYFDVPQLDPILSLLIACWVLFNVYRNIKNSFSIILQGTPDNISIEELKNRLMELPDVEDVHDCHLWSMDGTYNVFTAHLVIRENKTLKELATIKKQALERLGDLPVHHVTVEFELPGEHCTLENC